MANLLIINSSPRSQSVSRRLAQQFASDWASDAPGTRIVERKLSSETLPLIDESWIQASYTPEAQRTPAQRKLLEFSDRLIEELRSANVVVLGVPMHNFTVPTALRAWIDLVTRAGKTFAYDEKGAKGLLPAGKKVVVIATRGGPYVPASATDFVEPYLRHILGFIGLTDIIFIHADRQGMGGKVGKEAIDNAARQLSAVTHECTQHLASFA